MQYGRIQLQEWGYLKRKSAERNLRTRKKVNDSKQMKKAKKNLANTLQIIIITNHNHQIYKKKVMSRVYFHYNYQWKAYIFTKNGPKHCEIYPLKQPLMAVSDISRLCQIKLTDMILSTTYSSYPKHNNT